MKKIGFVSEKLHSGGGIELFELEVAKRLAHRGWQISIAYHTGGDLVPQWQQFAEAEQQDFASKDADTSLASRLKDCDVVYAHRPGDFLKAYQVSRMVQAPVVLHLHVPPWHLRKGWKRMVLGATTQSMDPRVFSRRSQVDKFLAVSAHTAGLWVKSGLPQEKIEVIFNGVDTHQFHPGHGDKKSQVRQQLGISPDAVVVGYVGRIDEAKGIRQLLQAFSLVSAKTAAPLTLVVIGEATRSLGAQGEQLTAELKQKAVGDVRWLGKRRDLPRLYQAMDILVTPSQWDEPFGLVAVEGLASQLPVIATKTGGLQEVLAGSIDENLVGKTPTDIAARLGQLVEDKPLRESLGSRGRTLAQTRFDIEHTVDEIEQQLFSLVEPQSPVPCPA
jgi:glycosyltransferase involved in cell wall biosynthesis